MDELSIEKNDDEISLIDLFAVLLRRKWMIIITTAIACIAVVVVCIMSLKLPPEKSFMPNKYTPRAQMLINNKESSSNSIASMLGSSGLGNLASLAGVNVGGGATNSALASYLVNSNTIQDEVINKFDLVTRYKIKKSPVTYTRKKLKENLASNFDDKTGVFTISFTDRDPVFAQSVVNYVVDRLEQRFLEIGVDQNKLAAANLEENINTSYNRILDLQSQVQKLEQSSYMNYGQSSIVMDSTMLKMELEVQEQIYAGLKAQYESLKITMASEQPVFQILEYAEIPDEKSGPSRGKLCIIVAFAAFFLSVFLAFLLNAVENIKKDPQAMAKLKGK